MNIKRYFSNHIFFYIIALAMIVSAVASFYRFIIKNDYLVYHQGTCNPQINSCFEQCEEDECTHYMKIQKYASDLLAQCGKDITDCETANVCLPGDSKCSITYCDVKIDQDCKIITDTPTGEQNINIIE